MQIVYLCLQGVFSLKKSYFEPRYILLFPSKVEKYRDRLKSRGLYTPEQIEMAVSRTELYAKTNRQRPGFFDNVIPCGTAKKHFVTEVFYYASKCSFMLFDAVVVCLSVHFRGY